MKSLFSHLGTTWSGPFFGLPLLRKLFWLMVLALYPALANAVTYANASTTYGWIDASTHTKLGPTTGGVYSPTYSFSNTGGCGSNVPYIDDSMSSNIPIGFTFMYGGVNFTDVRIQSNGRLQFNNNITCGYGSPVTQLPYPDAGLNYTMRIYGGDLDPSLQSEIGGGYVTNCVSRAACYVSYATIGTAPYRSFVVTWSNVPEWTSFASATGSYNVQVILQENGEFVYQYGANTPGPGNTVGQVGWQVDSNDYAVPQTGYPANNTAIKFSIPQPVAEYRMEQPSWSAAAGQILDTSGRGNHASRIGAAQTTATGYLCRGALIPSNNAIGTVDAINTNLAVPTALGGAGTITFWYKPANWASNGNQDAQLFDATTASPDWFFLVKRRSSNSNVVLRFVIRDSAGNDRVAETGNLTNAVLSATGWVHIAVSWNFNALAGGNKDHMRIYVNGAQTLETTFTTAGTVSAGIGTLYVGDNRSGTIGNNGTGRSADGTLDEVRLYNYEGGLALVQRDKDQGGTACLAHYAISHAGTARACDVVPITITAHDSSHNSLLMPNNTTTIQLSTSTGKGDWSLLNGYGVLNNGTADDGIATYLFNGEYQAIFGLAHTTSGNVNINVTDGQTAESEDPLLTLTSCSAVAKFNACHNYASGNCSTAAGRLYTRLAGAAFATDVVSLNSSGVLDNTFTGKAVVSLIARAATGAVDAANCFTPDFTQTLDNAATSFVAGKLTVNGTVVNAYPDARIKVVCDATNCPPSGIAACSADNFAIRPLSIALSSTTANADSTGTSTSATPVIQAGTSFGLTATASAGYNGTPKLDAAQAVAHAGAVSNGTVAGNFGAAAVATGVATGAAFTYSEVGYFNLGAGGVYDDTFTAVDPATDCTNDFSNIPVGNKYGCKFGNTAATSYFGRFVPDHFALNTGSFIDRADINTGAAETTCASSFTYMGEDFKTTFTLVAQNAASATTQNYTGGHAKFGLTTWSNFVFSASGGTLAAASTAPSGAWSSTAGSYGTAAVTATHVITRPATPAAALTGFSLSAKPSYADDTATIALAASTVVHSGTSEQRFGRLWLGNAYGSDKIDLVMPFEAQYWNGSAFLVNTNDNCTGVAGGASGNVALGNKQGGLSAYTGPIAGGTASSGAGGITLTKPASAAAGSVDVLVNLGSGGSPTNCSGLSGGSSAALSFLSGKWCGSNYDRDPTARATFGVYGSSTRKGTIYRRESY